MSLTKNFTQGGQVTLHNLRMIRQVLSVTFGTTLLISLFFFCFKTWQDHAPYQRQITLTYLVAQLKTSLPFGDINKRTQIFVYEDGKKQKVRSVDILNDRWMKDQIGYIEDMLIYNFFLSAIVFLTTFLGFMGFWVWRGKARMKKEILSGSREASMNDVIKIMRQKNKISDIYLDKMPLLKDSETKHILLVGTIGSGKTNTFNHLLPQIRKRKQKAVIVDTTGVFVEKFYNSRTDIILNPFDARTQAWDIWRECENDIHADELAASLVPQALHDPFWSDAARTLFVETLKKLKRTENPSLKSLVDYAINQPLSEIQNFYAGTPAASLVDKAGDKTAASIRVNLATYIRCLFLQEESSSPFSIRKWIQDEKQTGWLFLTAMPDQRETLRPLLTTQLNIAINSLMGLRPDQDRRVWFIIDEKPSLNKVEALPKALAEIRKYGGCIVAGLQNISQIDKLYGHEVRKTMSSLYNTKVFFRTPDSDTAQWISKTVGDHEIKESSEGISFGAHQMRDGVSINEQQKSKAVIPYTEFMSIPDLSAYIKLPEDYPVTRITFSYKNIENKNVAFVEKPHVVERTALAKQVNIKPHKEEMAEVCEF
ncbi:type IV conjugative transfer system coupling protein TraD [Candidatus Paracaedibacter symbiosus]|uniref:type IV conjugative transfer system coupling protein TraD n=1 Tax=Candidatus Paracaedibacter symbiosus TaxID=244582 RepID=UPI000509DDF2|nr:type IV conjugative transfer system coupling protein TraD [Candidatus Paracaedibacter symbiosus]